MTFIKKPFLATIIIVLCIFFAYSFMLQSSFKTMDDEISIVQNDLIKDWRNFPQIFRSSFFESQAYYRPLVSVSFMLEYFLFGLKPLFYYLTNILIHATTAMVLYGLVHLLLDEKTVAFCVALLFGIHPVHWEAVSNIPGRSILLCALFSLAAFTFYCLYRQRKKRGLYIISLIFFILALLSKESAGILPLTLLCYGFIMLAKNKNPGDLRTLGLSVLPYFAIDALYLGLRNTLGITKLYYWRFPYEAFLGFVTFLRSLLTHLRLLVLPVGLQFDRSRAVFVGLKNPEALGTLLIFILGVILLIRKRKSLSSLSLFCILWFFIEFIPVSQMLVSIGVQPGFISTAEHFLYVPSIAAFILIGLSGKRLYEWNLTRKIISPKIFKFGIMGLFFFLLLVNIQNNIYASNEMAMFERTLTINPRNVRVRMSLAHGYAKLNRFELAEQHYRRAVEAGPYNVRARIGLGKALCDLGRTWEGLAVYESIADPEGLRDLWQANLHATYIFLTQKYNEILKDNPQNIDAIYSLGVVYSKMGDVKQAKEYYRRTLALNPQHPYALFNLASILQAHGELEEAEALYKRLLALKGVEEYLREQTMKQMIAD